MIVMCLFFSLVESHARVSRSSADGLKQKEQDSYLQCLVREVVGNSRMIQTVKRPLADEVRVQAS